MELWKTDVSVLLVFFVRDETFKRVFESVRQSRPRRLLLWQDGPRKGKSSDLEGIKKCREIAENVDWECEIYKHYNEENLGCDPSTFLAFKWAFSIVDKCIILEDDQVPSQSYFTFCKELLDKYEFDERISHICGYNILGVASWCPNDYLFAYTGSGAWASWRRVADSWEDKYEFLHDEYALNNLKNKYGKRSEAWIKTAIRHEKTGKEYWESIIGLGCAINSRYAIIPKYNLVQNWGISDNATHSSVNDLRLIGRAEQKLYLQKGEEITFPLKHPKYVIPDNDYMAMLDKRNNMVFLVKGKIQMVINMIRYRKFNLLLTTIRRKLHRGGIIFDSSSIYSSIYWAYDSIAGKGTIVYA